MREIGLKKKVKRGKPEWRQYTPQTLLEFCFQDTYPKQALCNYKTLRFSLVRQVAKENDFLASSLLLIS
jgi:hypothetical protein